MLLQSQETTGRIAARSIDTGNALIIFIELAVCKTLASKRTARTTRAAIETPPEQYRHMRDGTASASRPRQRPEQDNLRAAPAAGAIAQLS